MKTIKIIFTTLLLLLSVASVYAQGRKISGKILSPLNKPIEGAIISAVGSKDAKTGVDGTFKMELKENTTQISVWAAGYYPETRLVDDNSQVVILMMPESTYKYNESAVLPMRIESSRPELTSAVNINKKDFTQGSILKKLFWFMLPILGALVLQAAYGAVDLLVVGRFGTTSGLSAVSTGSQVLNLVTFVITQFAMGITVLIARYIGEKKPQYIGALIGGATIIFAIVSAVLFVVMIGFAQPIAVLMQAPQEAVELTSSYVRICGGGIFFIVAYNLLAAIF